MQQDLIIGYLIINVCVVAMGVYQSFVKKNAYTLTPPLILLGSFVWGDTIIISSFWIIISAISLYLNDWYLFGLLVSVFWVIRNLGEAIFWFNQQFSQKIIYAANTLPGYKYVGNDSIWFIYQIINQCFAVMFVVSSLYFGHMWLKQF